MNCRRLFVALLTVTVLLGGVNQSRAADDLADIKAQIAKQHDESLKRLQDWIGQVSIAAEDRGYPEGAEYIGSPHIGQLVRQPEVLDAVKKCVGVFMPTAAQDLDGIVTVNLGSKGVIELELVSTGEKWGRGPGKDIHSSLKAMIDSPAWHLVKALDTLVSADGNTIMIDGYPKPRPISAEEKAMIAEASKRRSEAQAMKSF